MRRGWALLRDLDLAEPAPQLSLAYMLLLRFVDANDAPVSAGEEERLP